MALALTKLVGFHWSYLPGTALELIPGADLAPSWTAAAWLATRVNQGPGAERRWFVTAGIATMFVAAAMAWYFWLHRK